MKESETLPELPKYDTVTQRANIRKNGAEGLAWGKVVTNIRFVKNTIICEAHHAINWGMPVCLLLCNKHDPKTQQLWATNSSSHRVWGSGAPGNGSACGSGSGNLGRFQSRSQPGLPSLEGLAGMERSAFKMTPSHGYCPEAGFLATWTFPTWRRASSRSEWPRRKQEQGRNHTF